MLSIRTSEIGLLIEKLLKDAIFLNTCINE